ncbi:MAG: winged helix-turn-helix transcriptional regulator [Candidatus Heimdallarchaeaceae archaeon]
MSSIPITYQDYEILLLLQNEPTISFNQIAKKLGITPPTAKKKVESLKKRNIYRGKAVLYKPESLNLTRYFFILYTPSLESLQYLEAALKYHPYIISRTRFYGSRLGVFAQFNYPKEKTELLFAFIDALKKEGFVSSYLYYESLGSRRTMQIDLERLSLSSFRWTFDWEKCYSKLLTINPSPLPSPSPSVLDKMKPVDFKILEILTRGKIPKNDGGFDSEITQKKISNYLNIETTEIWRRYHFLQENVLSGYSSRFSREFFNINSEKIIFMTFKDETKLTRCFTLFTDEKEGPPFRYHIEAYRDSKDRKQLILYVSLPQYHEAHLIYTLSKTASLRVYNVDTIGKSSVSYSFYSEAFDFKKKKWKVEDQFVLDGPLKEIKEELEL